MKNFTLFIITLVVVTFIFSCKEDSNDLLLLKDANLVDIENGRIVAKSILIENDFIKSIGEYKDLLKHSPTTEIDCNGTYVIPGLFDMHMHIAEHENSIPLLGNLLRNGITSIRDMGGIVDTIATTKKMIHEGQLEGPHIYFAGVTLDGPQTNDPFHLQVNDTTDLKTLLLKLKNKGIDLLKVHNYFPIDRLVELKNAGNELGLSISGHIPVGIGPMELDSVGIKCVEHINSLLSGLILKESNNINTITEAFATLDSTYVSKLSNYFNENGIAFTPTLLTLEGVYYDLEDEALREKGVRMMKHFYEITNWMNQNDVLLLSGSDMGPINDTTINALHGELERMVKSGLSSYDALKTATINPSKFLNIDHLYGSISENKKADLVILYSNPIDDISNTKDIKLVLKDGLLYNRQ